MERRAPGVEGRALGLLFWAGETFWKEGMFWIWKRALALCWTPKARQELEVPGLGHLAELQGLARYAAAPAVLDHALLPGPVLGLLCS